MTTMNRRTPVTGQLFLSLSFVLAAAAAAACSEDSEPPSQGDAATDSSVRGDALSDTSHPDDATVADVTSEPPATDGGQGDGAIGADAAVDRAGDAAGDTRDATGDTRDAAAEA